MTMINMKWAINQALQEEMRRDPSVVIVGEDVGTGGVFAVTRGLREQFGEWRVKDTPISEDAIAGLGVGAAFAGMRPVIEIMFNDFFTVSLDPICSQAATVQWLCGKGFKLPMVVRTMCGTGFGAGMHHSQSLEAWLVHKPGLKVVMPSNAYDAKGLLKAAIRGDSPVIFMEHKACYTLKSEVPDAEYLLPIGVADVKREGSDVSVVTYGRLVHTVLAAAARLDQDGVSAEVLDLRTLSPLDEDAIVNSVKKTGRLVVVQEAQKRCSVGAEVAAVAAEKAMDYLEAKIKRVTPPPIPVPFGSAEKFYAPQEEDIIKAVREIVG
ncbi:MAG: alpha-ketoacid dehydrogenase subunit beta [Chloroflexi bacterium]|nr:alpha-ketoacid dehydrogenase subunit beta [Chloroflexota bacterium]